MGEEKCVRQFIHGSLLLREKYTLSQDVEMVCESPPPPETPSQAGEEKCVCQSTH